MRRARPEVRESARVGGTINCRRGPTWSRYLVRAIALPVEFKTQKCIHSEHCRRSELYTGFYDGVESLLLAPSRWSLIHRVLELLGRSVDQSHVPTTTEKATRPSYTYAPNGVVASSSFGMWASRLTRDYIGWGYWAAPPG